MATKITRFGGWIDNWSTYLREGSCVWWVKIISYMQVHCTLSASKCILFDLHLCKRNKQPHKNKSHENVISNVHKRPTKSLTHRKKVISTYRMKYWQYTNAGAQMCTVRIRKWKPSDTIDRLVKQLHKNNAWKICIHPWSMLRYSSSVSFFSFTLGFVVNVWPHSSGPTKMPRTPWPSLI